MAKRKVGLHKEIKSIFDGVPIPKDNGAKQPSYVPAPEHERHEEQSMPNEWRLEEASVPEKPAASVAKTAPAPRAQRPAEAPPKAAPTKRPKADTTIKTAEGNPLQKSWQQIQKKLFTPKPGVSAAKQKTMAIFIPILFIILIFVLVQVVGIVPRKTKGATKNKTANIAVAGTNKIDWQIPDPYPATLRDPTQFGPADTAQVKTGKLIVKGIVYSKNNPSASSASIGNQIVHEGEKASGATVVKINENSIEFEMDGKRWTQKVQR